MKWVSALGVVMALAGGLTGSRARPVAAESAYEPPPLLRATDLAPAELLEGPRFRVDPQVVTDGLLTRFTVRSDFGTFEAAGPGMLRVRVGEVRALADLETVTKGEVFAKALAESAKRTGKSLQAAVENPEETIKGIPEGVGRFFDRVGRSVRTGAQKAGDQAAQQKAQGAGAGEVAADVGSATGRTAGEVLGYYDARRRLAKDLGVDPYTKNPALDKKLDEVAWAAFAGEFGLNRAVGAVPGVGMLANSASWFSDLVWESSPGDLRVMIEKKLLGMGVAQDTVDRFLRHRWWTLTQQTGLVVRLDTLTGVPGRAAVLPLALTVASEEQARFVAGTVAILARIHKSGTRITQVSVAGTVLGKAGNGALVVPAPVDYVVWTERAATFARRPDLKAPTRGIWLPGQVSPRARQELTRLGWAVHERFSASGGGSGGS